MKSGPQARVRVTHMHTPTFTRKGGYIHTFRTCGNGHGHTQTQGTLRLCKTLHLHSLVCSYLPGARSGSTLVRTVTLLSFTVISSSRSRLASSFISSDAGRFAVPLLLLPPLAPAPPLPWNALAPTCPATATGNEIVAGAGAGAGAAAATRGAAAGAGAATGDATRGVANGDADLILEAACTAFFAAAETAPVAAVLAKDTEPRATKSANALFASSGVIEWSPSSDSSPRMRCDNSRKNSASG